MLVDNTTYYYSYLAAEDTRLTKPTAALPSSVLQVRPRPPQQVGWCLSLTQHTQDVEFCDTCGFAAPEGYCRADCNGTIRGVAIINECGTCVLGETGRERYL